MPAIVIAAFANDLNRAIDAHRRLIARWSCSMRLLRYLFVRTLTLRQHKCSRRSSHRARRLGTWPSSVTFRRMRGSVDASAFRKNACAPAVLRQQATEARRVAGKGDLRRGDARSYRGAPGFREHVAVEIVEFGVVDSTIRVTMRATSSVKRFVSNRQLCEMMGLETGRLKFHG